MLKRDCPVLHESSDVAGTGICFSESPFHGNDFPDFSGLPQKNSIEMPGNFVGKICRKRFQYLLRNSMPATRMPRSAPHNGAAA